MALIVLFFTQSVTIRPFIRYGAGEAIYGEPETRKCRLERGKKLKNGRMGSSGVIEEIPAGARMYCVGSPIPTGSIVEYGDRDYVVTECRILNGFMDDHLEVALE